MRIAARRGYEGTTLTQVVRATGLPASSIYWHFRSKDELLAEVLEYSYRRWEAVAPIRDRRAGGPWQLWLYDRFAQVRVRLIERPEYWRMGLMLALERQPGGSRARDRFLGVRGESIAMLTERWAAVLDPEAVAVRPWLPGVLGRLELAGIDGLFLAQQSDDRWDLDRLLWLFAYGMAAVARRLVAEPAHAVPLVDDALDGSPGRAGTAPRAWETGARSASHEVADPGAGDGSDGEDGTDESDGEFERQSGRERLLRAAEEVAAEHGYQGTTISRVCRRAGLPGSSVYWFFKDKDALLAAVVQHSYAQWRSRQFAPGPVPPGARWVDTLRGPTLDNWAALADNPNFLRFGYLLLLERRENSPTGRDMFQGIRHHTLGLYLDWFGRALPPELVAERPTLPANLARLMMALSDGMLISLQVDRPAWEPRRFAELAINILEAATRCPPEAPPLDDETPATCAT